MWQQRGKAKWEVMWVIFIEVMAYGSNIISPDAEHVTFQLENGAARPTNPHIHRSLVNTHLVVLASTPHSTPSPCSTQVALGSCMRCIMYVVRHVRRVDALRRLGADLPGATHDAGQVHMDMDMACMGHAHAIQHAMHSHARATLNSGMHVYLRCTHSALTSISMIPLASMTTAEGTKVPTVRLVPLLVANLTMILFGITAGLTSSGAKWFIFGGALCFGGFVFSSAIQVMTRLVKPLLILYSLYYSILTTILTAETSPPLPSSA